MADRILVFRELKEEFRLKILQYLPFDYRPALELAAANDYSLDILEAMLSQVTTDDGLYLD